MTILKVEKYPTIGNLVKTEYLIGPSNFSGLNRTMPCHSVLLKDSKFDIDGLIISETELVNARTRYIRKATDAVKNVNGKPLGLFNQIQITSDNKNKKLFLTWFVVFTSSDEVPCGYMFSDSEMNTIIARPKRIPSTIVRLSWWQKFILWVREKIFG